MDQQNTVNQNEEAEARHVIISQFLESRSQEIGYFCNQLQQKFNMSNKLPYQKLKKHLRRRAMSHNRYRIPSRIRNKMNINELDVIEKTQNPIKCRKNLRKPKLLMNSYIRRSKKVKWMETHLWHSKRMRMIEYFKYKVAEKPNDKGDRASYRFANHECVVYDKSYYIIFSLEGDSLFEALQSIIKEENIKILKAYSKLNNKVTPLFNIYKNDMNEIIGPAQFYFANENKLFAIVHPGMKDELIFLFENKLTNVKFNLLEDSYNIFELIGPQSLYKFNQLLLNLGLTQDNINELHPLIKQFQYLSNPSNYPTNYVFQISFSAQVQKKLVHPPFNFTQQTISEFNQQNQILFNQALSEICNYQNKKKSENITFFSQLQTFQDNKEYTKRFIQITRGKYTHKKKNKIAVKQKNNALKESKIKKENDKEKIKKEQEKNKNEQEKNKNGEQKNKNEQQNEQNIEQQKELIIEVEKEQQNIDIVIIFRNDQQYKLFGEGITIILNQGKGNLVWRILSYLATKAIGLSQYNFIQQEANVKVFPQDYPLTQSYKQITKLNVEKKIKKFIRTPKRNRCNYQRISSPYPFCPNFDDIFTKFLQSDSKVQIYQEDLQEVQITMCGRGKPKENAYICVPLDEDISNYLKMKQQNDKIYNVYQEQVFKSKNDKSISDESYIQKLSQIQTSRNIIGFVTSGIFSFRMQKGKAKGYILKYLLENLQNKSQQNEQFCLIRNPTSRQYYIANFKIL